MEQTRFDKEQKDMEEIDRVEIRRLMGVEFEKNIQRPDIQRRLEKGSTGTVEHLNNIIRVVWGEAAAGGLTSEDSRKLTAANLAINGDGI